MKRYDNGSNDLDHVSRLPRWIGIAGAILLVILLKACSFFAGSRDFDARNRIQAHGTGPSAPAVGQIIPIPPLVYAHSHSTHRRFQRANKQGSTQVPMKPPLTSKVRLFLGATAFLCSLDCRQNHQAKSPPAPLVEVATVTQADVPVYYEAIGVLDGLVNAQIRAQPSPIS